MVVMVEHSGERMRGLSVTLKIWKSRKYDEKALAWVLRFAENPSDEAHGHGGSHR